MLGREVVYEGNLFTLLSMTTNYCDAQLATNRHRSLRIWYKDPYLALFCTKKAQVLQRQQISPADMHHQALASSQAQTRGFTQGWPVESSSISGLVMRVRGSVMHEGAPNQIPGPS